MKMEDVAQPEKGCPECGARAAYQLADGRRMCRICRRKYTPKVHQNNLSDAMLDKIARAFWAELSAEKAAQECLVNRKTAQRYYRRIRLALAQESHQRQELLAKAIASARLPQKRLIALLTALPRVGPELVIAPVSAEILTLFEAEYAQVKQLGEGAISRAGPARKDALCWEPRDWENVAAMARDAEEFWRFAQRWLGAYRGGTAVNYRLFIKEIEFRYNQRNRKNVQRTLVNMVSGFQSGGR